MRSRLRRLLGIHLVWNSAWIGTLTQHGIRTERTETGVRHIINRLSLFRLYGVHYGRGFFGVIRRLPERGEPE